jgi:acetolactate synthase I/II/III large subunit
MEQEPSYSHGFAVPGDQAATHDGVRTADVLVDVLVEAGVEVIFGIPGGAIAPLNDALIDHPEIRVVTTRHESGAMFAAAAYARMTGKVGVVFVTSGPGLLNTMTGLASAYCDGLPVVLLAGEVPRSVFGRQALQEGSSHHLDVVTSCRPLTKMAVQVPFSDVAPSMLKRAIATALSGRRGPVLLTLPLDVLSKPIRVPRLVSDVGMNLAMRSDAMGSAVSEVAAILTRARRPLIFAGSGARWGDAPQRLRALAERLQVPVMTTPKAKGVFPESHPLSLGVFGYGGHPSANRYLEDGLDVLLAVGSSLGDVATNGWSKLLSPTDQFIQIDADAMQIGRNYPVTCGLVGDAAVLLEEILKSVPRRPVALRRFGVKRYEDPVAHAVGPEGLITPMRAIWELQQRMPHDTIYTCDIGEHLLFATHYLHVDSPDGFLIMTGLGSMGSSIAGAVGARLGMPKRPVAVVCGDGCFSMSIGDLAVAVKERVPIVVAVLNDERYGMVEIGNTAVYGRTPDYSLGMNVPLMARSVGARAVSIDKAGEISNADLSGLDEGVPVVLDVHIDRHVRMPRNERFDNLKAAQAKPPEARILN